MPRYKYTYYLNNEEVDQNTFELRLQTHYAVCDTNYDNPLLNISYTDTKRYYAALRQLKSNPRCSGFLFTDYNGQNCESFRIKRELIKK